MFEKKNEIEEKIYIDVKIEGLNEKFVYSGWVFGE